MTVNLDHSPAVIVQQLLVDLGVVTNPESSLAWPCYATRMPNNPDECLTVQDTDPRLAGRTHVDGETQKFHGIQVYLRSLDFSRGWLKMQGIGQVFDRNVVQRTVVIDSSLYLVWAITITSGPLSLGFELPNTFRRVFSLNAVVSVHSEPGTGTGTGTG